MSHNTLSIILVSCLIAWGAELWDGLVTSCKLLSRQANGSLEVTDGRAVFKGDMEPMKHKYLEFKIETTPFRMGDKSLALKVENRKLRDGNCFYVRGLNRDGGVVVSFYTFHPLDTETELVLVPGRDDGFVRWFADNVTAPIEDEITTLRFFQHCSEQADLEIAISDIRLVDTPVPPKPMEVKDYGMAVKGGTARGIYAVADEVGREYLLVWLMDNVNKRNLQIDVETGETTVVPIPNIQHGDAVYSSILSRAGKCYTEFGHRFYEYDVTRKAFTADFKCHPHQAAMSMCEDAEGRIWAAIYPDCGLVCFDPKTREFTDYGAVNQENWAQYPRTVEAGRDGWIYIGVGSTRGQIVAFNPMTREARALLPKEERPNPSTFYVRYFTDGLLYGRYNEQAYRLENGEAVRTALPADASIAYPRSGTQGYVYKQFPSGRTFESIDLAECEMLIREADGKCRTVKFDYENYGAGMMSIDVTEDGIVGGGSFFPFRFGTLNPATGAKTDEACGVQCNAIVAHGKYFYIAGYSGGQVLRLDPTQPWTLKLERSKTARNLDSNPRYYGKATPDVIRPHCVAVSPDGRYYVMGGTPGYGLTGGGIAIVDLESDEMRVVGHKELALNEAPSALAITKDNIAVIGTTTAPGTGGEKLASSISLMLYDLANRKLIWKSVFPMKAERVTALHALPNGKVIGLAGGFSLFSFDVEARRFGGFSSVEEFGGAIGAQGPRVFMEDGGTVFILLQQGVGVIDYDKCRIAKFHPIPGRISAGGGVHKGVFYYMDGVNWKSAVIPTEP